MNKDAQAFVGVTGKTLQDLYAAISMDTGLSSVERHRLIQQISELMGQVPPQTPLQSLLWKLSGAGLGLLVARYFNLGLVGQGVLAATGLGLGSLIQNRLTQQYVSNIYSSLQP